MSGAMVPQLRFPGFAGEWTVTYFGDLTTIASGQVDPAVEPYASMPHVAPDNIEGGTGNIRNVRTAREDGVFSGKYAFDERAIVYSKIRPNLNKVARPGFIGICSADMYPIWGAEGRLNTDYLLQVMRGEGFVSAATAVSMRTGLPKINRPDLNAIAIPLPASLPEQEKIADFLGTVDAKLDALRRKKSGLEAFKSGLMQRLFSQELRFTRDDGTEFLEWEERELAEIGERSKDKNKDLEINRVLTNSATQGIIDQGDYFDKDIANAESLSGYYIARFGDYVYNPRISVSAPVGPINRNNLADGVMSPLYTVFRIKDGVSDFFAHYFSSNFWHDYMKGIANYGARHDRMAISMADFMAMPLPWPHPDEQRKIADALTALDAKIAAIADQITHMETFKKGLLQQMFV